MAYNKLRKLLGMKPKADKTTSEKGVTTVTDYFPDFSVKEVAEYREDGSQLSVSRYSKGQISEKTDYLVDGGQTFSLYSDGVLTEQTTTRADGEKTVTAFAKGKKTERTTYHPDGRRTVDSFENGKQTGTAAVPSTLLKTANRPARPTIIPTAARSSALFPMILVTKPKSMPTAALITKTDCAAAAANRSPALFPENHAKPLISTSM